MSSILRAKKGPPFIWWYALFILNEDGLPKQNIDEGLRQPDTMMIKFYISEMDVSARGRIREVSSDIVPYKGILGPAYSIIFTVPQYKDKVIRGLDATDPKYVSQLFTLFGQCLQGMSATKSAAVLTK